MLTGSDATLLIVLGFPFTPHRRTVQFLDTAGKGLTFDGPWINIPMLAGRSLRKMEFTQM